jgi:hypothetical protein
MNREEKIQRASSIMDEFMQNAQPSDLFQRVHEEILKESAKNPIDPYWVRVNQDWSVLGHQVMGAEVF